MGKGRKNSVNPTIPLFIDKLCQILQDESCSDYIDWTSDEESFIIKDINRFTDTVLPKYFKHSNFSSFIRQLNMYNFHKLRHDEGQNVYNNEYFKRQNRQLLKSIKRKINQNQRQDQVMLYQPTNIAKEMNQLKNKQRNLQNLCKTLINQNNKLLEENRMMMKHLSQNQKQKNSKMEQLFVSLIMARGNNQLTLPQSQNARLLSLTNKERPADSVNICDNFKEFFEDPDNYTRFRQALRAYQNLEDHRNHTIDRTSPEANYSESNIEHNLQQESENLNLIDEKDHQMLSLNDFLNMDSPSEMI